MPAPEQITVNLRQQTPEGWTLRGLSAPQWDGVNFFRIAQPKSEIRFSTPEPRYLRFQYRLDPPQATLTAEVFLDGRFLGRYHFSKEKFEIFYPTAFVAAGRHVLRLSYSCDDGPCRKPAPQYYTELLIVSLDVPQKSVGLYAQQFNLNVPRPDWRFVGLSELKFDGVNYFRTLDSSSVAIIIPPQPLSLVDLRYKSLSNQGNYRLLWKIDGGPERQAVVEQQGLRRVLPEKKIVDQYLSLVQPSKVERLQVRAECVGGGDTCFPIRLYFPRVTVLQEAQGYLTLSTQQKLFAATLLMLLLALLFWLLFRPSQRRRAGGPGLIRRPPTTSPQSVDWEEQ